MTQSLLVVLFLSASLLAVHGNQAASAQNSLAPEEVEFNFGSAEDGSFVPEKVAKRSLVETTNSDALLVSRVSVNGSSTHPCMTYDEASWVNVASDKTHLPVGGGSQMFVSHDGRTVYSYGGCEQPGHPAACNNQLLRFDTLGSRWAAVTIATEAIDPNALAHRVQAGAWAWDANNERMWVWGGIRPVTPNGKPDAASETFSSSLDFLEIAKDHSKGAAWHHVETKFQAILPTLAGASLTFYGDDKLVVFGGYSDDGFFNDLYVATRVHGAWSWEKAKTGGNVPSPRAGHTATMVGDKIYVFGGAAADPKNDMFTLTSTSDGWLWEEVHQANHVPARTGHAVVAVTPSFLIDGNDDRRVNTLLLVGGCNGATFECFGTVARFDTISKKWSTPAVNSHFKDVVGRSKMAVAFVPAIKRVMALGGCDFAGKKCDNVLRMYTPEQVCAADCVHGTYVMGTMFRPAMCTCDEAWAGEKCDTPSYCPNQCSGHGTCRSDGHGAHRCHCNKDFHGDDCGRMWCPRNCTSHGICIDTKLGKGLVPSVCKCDKGYLGSDCSQMDRFTAESTTVVVKCKNHCSGKGHCLSTDETFMGGKRGGWGKCHCLAGFAGDDCSVECPNKCGGSSSGQCQNNGKCECFEGFKGRGCEQTYCANNCTGNGICNNDRCYCKVGFVGNFCQLDADCNDHGTFSKGHCTCEEGWGGPDCKLPVQCPNDCSHSGKCTDPTRGGRVKLSHVDLSKAAYLEGVCQCSRGHGGRDCSLKLCMSGCHGHGRCNTFRGTCTCYPGYKGKDCEINVPCPGNCTSAAHGTCDAVTGKCHCSAGWTGAKCGSLRCPNDCSKNGKCVRGRCLCKSGFFSRDCSVGCKPGCGSHGICKMSTKGKGKGAAPKCKCDPEWEGVGCEKKKQCPKGLSGGKAKQCSGRNGVCWTAKKKCICRQGYSGKDCGKVNKACGAQGCNKRGTCEAGICFCDMGYTGKHCEKVEKCPKGCSDRGFCSHGECFCYPGRTGVACEKSVKDKTCPKDCSGAGLCQFGKCFCLPGRAGKDCAQVVDFCKVPENSKCSGHGVCEFGKCFCEPSSSGKRCEKHGCKAGCKAGQGECILGKCRCFPGYAGKSCQKELSCPSKNSQPCSGHGACVMGKCACESGYRGRACDKLAFQTPDCPNKCSNVGVCHGGKCFCVDGYSGPDCSLRQGAPCKGNCNGKGKCAFGRCFCNPGWKGAGCNKEIKCSKKCERNGICSYGRCMCPPGVTGADCDELTSPATKQQEMADAIFPKRPGQNTACPNACNYRGLCDAKSGKCTCTPPFTGSDCSFTLDDNARCPGDCNGNNGECIFGSCICRPGFTGKACELKVPMECPNNCNGRGSCWLGECICEPGFKGESCNDEDSCPHCGNTGVCVRGKCACVQGFAGVHCEKRDDSHKPTASVNTAQKLLSFKETSSSFDTSAPTFNGDASCKSGCGAHGVCSKGACFCATGFAGAECQTELSAAAVALAEVGSSSSPSSPFVMDNRHVALLCLASFFIGAIIASLVKCAIDRHNSSLRKQQMLQPLIANA